MYISILYLFSLLVLYTYIYMTASLVKWSAYLTTDHEVADSILGTSTNFKCGLGLERGSPSLVRTVG